MAVNCSNIKASPAFKGQSAIVTLSEAESLSIIPVLELGQECLSESSQATGHVDWIDTYGHSFSIKPAQPNLKFNSGETDTLAVDELITVTT